MGGRGTEIESRIKLKTRRGRGPTSHQRAPARSEGEELLTPVNWRIGFCQIMSRGKCIKNLLKFVDERKNNNASHSLQPPTPAASEDTTSVEASEAPSQAAVNSISSDGATPYLMMKEGGIPEALVGFFSSREANDAESEPTTPFGVRRSAGDSNRHPRTNI
ncbi:hypothetical protein Ahy_A09g043760 [Arachis hypogaea]|uniref:Uncharacterized protein n=1 Tax=Arachis hypogaea TaxID=3818 RepID=A0A445BJ05_ARAHY|nr:hypothetical protein Ahy_A09g043760 [Arachis hypogaea]